MKRKNKSRWEFYYNKQWMNLTELSKVTGITRSCLRYRLITSNWSLESATSEFIEIGQEDWSP